MENRELRVLYPKLDFNVGLFMGKGEKDSAVALDLPVRCIQFVSMPSLPVVLKPRRNDFAAMLDGVTGLLGRVSSKCVCSCLLV